MSNIFSSIVGAEFALSTYLLCATAALICGVIAAVSAAFKSDSTKSFTVAIILMPLIVQTVIMMVNGNIGTGVAVMGAFSLVRFRSVPGKAKDIVSIFLAMTAGLACAAGFVGIALLFTVLVSAVMMLVVAIPLDCDKTLNLHITVPESLGFANQFDDIFKKYTKAHKLIKIKTCNMGSLYKLIYRIEIKNAAQTKDMIDEIRCRNGNLEVSVINRAEGAEEL